MKALMRSRMSLFTAGAAAFAGGLALLISNGERISEAAKLASANAAPTSAEPASGWNDLDFLLCHTPTKAASAMTSGMIRLAAAQTEVPQAKMNAASPAPAFRRHRSAAVGRARLASRTRSRPRASGASLFRSGTAARLRVQSRARRSAPSARRRSSIPTAPCASGARRWCSVPTSIFRCRKTRWRPPSRPQQKARALAAKASPREQALIAALVDALRRGPEGGPRTARCRLCRGHGARSRRSSRTTTRSRCSMPKRSWISARGITGSRAAREPNPQSVPIVPTLERVLARNPEPSRRNSLLHPRGRGVGPAEARRALCRPAARRDSRRRPPRAHAEPHLLSGRPLSRRAGRQQDRGRGR